MPSPSKNACAQALAYSLVMSLPLGQPTRHDHLCRRYPVVPLIPQVLDVLLHLSVLGDGEVVVIVNADLARGLHSLNLGVQG